MRLSPEALQARWNALPIQSRLFDGSVEFLTGTVDGLPVVVSGSAPALPMLERMLAGRYPAQAIADLIRFGLAMAIRSGLEPGQPFTVAVGYGESITLATALVAEGQGEAIIPKPSKCDPETGLELETVGSRAILRATGWPLSKVAVQATMPAEVTLDGLARYSLDGTMALLPKQGFLWTDGAVMRSGGFEKTLPALLSGPLEPLEVPRNPGRMDLVISCKEAVRLLDKVLPSMSVDATRPHLHSVRFERRSGVLSLITTDGHRLSVATAPNEGDDWSLTLPAEGAEGIRVMVGLLKDGTLRLTSTAKHAWATVGSYELVAKLMVERDGGLDFPAYEGVFPQDRPEAFARVRTWEILNAVTGLSIVSKRGGDTTVRVTYSPEGLKLESFRHADDPTAEVTLPVELEGFLPSPFGINWRYFLDAIRVFEDAQSIDIEFHGPKNPIVFRAKKNRAIVMPMRV